MCLIRHAEEQRWFAVHVGTLRIVGALAIFFRRTVIPSSMHHDHWTTIAMNNEAMLRLTYGVMCSISHIQPCGE